MPTRRPRTKAPYQEEEEEEVRGGGEEEQHGAVRERDAPFAPVGKRGERRLLSALVESRVGTPLGREPRSPDEKRALYLQLVRLKAARKTHEECAEAMGVSRSTIANYLADPLYKEMQAELISESKDRGHVLVGELIDFALERMVQLTGASSEFVRFKALEYILNAAGFSLPRQETQRDNQEGLSRFMELLSMRSGGGGGGRGNTIPPSSTVVNVEVHTGAINGDGKEAGEHIMPYIESSLSSSPSSPPSPQGRGEEEEKGQPGGGGGTSAIPPELAQYYQQVLPGGKLPPFLGGDDLHVLDGHRGNPAKGE